MNYKSIADLASDICDASYKIPKDVDLVVGIPRSGMLAASMLALNSNICFCDIFTFINNGVVKTGSTRQASGSCINNAHDARKILVLDDSIASGNSLDVARQHIANSSYSGGVIFGAVYGAGNVVDNKADILLKAVSFPRIFQWNLFHRVEAQYYCVDIDGVLCKDPTDIENDDGERYREFLLNATPLATPTYLLGSLVTSRLEKFREETEVWLAEKGIRYKNLYMLDLPSAQERRRLKINASFKADVYKNEVDSVLFVESEMLQAEEICRRSGKPVLDYGNQKLFEPGRGLQMILTQNRKLSTRIIRKIKRSAQDIFIGRVK